MLIFSGEIMYKRFVNTLYTLNIVFQALISLVTPVAFLFFISWLLVTKCSLPEWIYAISISIGFLSGFISMIKFVLTAFANLERMKAAEEKEMNNDNE